MFTAKEFRAMARAKLKGHWKTSVLVSFVAMLLGGVSGGGSSAGSGASGASANMANSTTSGTMVSGSYSGDAAGAWESFTEVIEANPVATAAIAGVVGIALIIALALFIIGAAVELGHDSYYIDLCSNREPGFDSLFSRFGIFLKALGLRFMMALFTLLWTLLFFIPGIIAAYRYAMAPYIMAQNPGVGVMEAIDQSKAMMKGRKWRLFCLQLSFIGWSFVCILTLGIGILWLTPYVTAATAAFYLDASGQGIPSDPQLQPQGV